VALDWPSVFITSVIFSGVDLDWTSVFTASVIFSGVAFIRNVGLQ